MRNKMVNIPNNFPKTDIKEMFSCGEIEDMQHIYECEQFNTTSLDHDLQYEKIYNGNISDQIKVFRKMEKNLERREDMRKHETPCDPVEIRCIPTFVVLD